MATAATAIFRRAKAPSWRSRNAAAIFPRWARVPVAATNSLNFGNPERPEIMAQLVEAIEGMAEACRFFDTPITGGNVSLYNETLGEGIYPTPVMGIVGTLKTGAPVTIPFKNAGRKVMLLGGIGDCDDMRFRRHPIRQGIHARSSGDCRRRSIWSTSSACNSPFAR